MISDLRIPQNFAILLAIAPFLCACLAYGYDAQGQPRVRPDASQPPMDATDGKAATRDATDDVRDAGSTSVTYCLGADAQSVSARDWYADCDGDGVQTGVAILACDLEGALERSPCIDHQAPDGGYYSFPGQDCDDELSTNRCPCGYYYDDKERVCREFPRSCRDVLQRNPSAPNGQYEIDPDGAGRATPFVVTCEMVSGGQTIIAQDDFASGDSIGWSAPDGTTSPVDTTSDCVAQFGRVLGGYGAFGSGATTSKTFGLRGVPHSAVVVALDYIVLDSWDGESALVYADGVERYRAAFNGAMGKADVCGARRTDLGTQHLSLPFAHSQDSLTLRITSTLNQSPYDECFAVDNVVIRLR